MVTEDKQPSPSGIAAMLTDQTSACAAAREAIAGGGEVVVLDREGPQWMVAGIAWRRLATTSKRGQPTLGLDETVEILARHRDEQLRTATIDTPDRSWFFTVYFDATGTELLACSGVNRSRSPDPKDSPDPVQPR
ncbi:hypothetical protein OG601_08180 [Streptomyces sp. NBC_01239]|uniref:hypothetical protein n=1 Tax=Streptomyces sp. NBC_01239 TaxID=2903792 RepID=UPI00225A7828|nr:hypothetical protein [Streptomyces sp. NBC_01239]MCX4810598.1 hypothetical protein [Streptomyces sp. NBC_01239]